MTQILTETEIQSHCSSSSVFIRGKSYFVNEAVEDLYYEPADKAYVAVVNGMDDYYVTLYTDKERKPELERAHCTCLAFQTYEGICKHIAAVALAVSYENSKKTSVEAPQQEMATVFEEESADELISSFQQVYERKKESYGERDWLDTEFILSITAPFQAKNGSVDLEMKIGPSRRYIVKDVTEFLEAMEKGLALRFSKLFTYHPSDYQFREEDLRVFEQLRKVSEVEKEMSTFYLRSYRTKEDKRRMTIPNPFLYDILSALKHCHVTVETDRHFYEPEKGVDAIRSPEKLPLRFNVAFAGENESRFRLEWENREDTIVLGNNYNALFHSGTFYFLTEAEKDTVLMLEKEFSARNRSSLTVSREKMMDLSSVVLPQLKTVGEVHIEPDVRRLIRAEPLRGKLYVDLVDDTATAKLEFHYGDVEIFPFGSVAGGEDIIVRDMDREMQLLSRIESVPFKYNGTELYLDDWDDVLEFLLVDVPDLSELMEVYMTSAAKKIIYTPTEDPRVQIEANEKLSLLDVTFQFEGIDSREIEQMLTALAENKKYYKLSSGAFINLQDERFDNMKAVLEQMPAPKDGYSQNEQVPLMKAFQLDEAGDEAIRRGRKFRELLERIYHPEEVDTRVPESLDGIMREYQKTGFRWLKTLAAYGFGGVLADDMGLGKTIQTIAYLQSEKEEGREGQALIVCPSSLIYNWEKEIHRFAPELKAAVISGPGPERKAAFDGAGDADVIITSYPLLRRDAEMYAETRFSVFILDEAQYVKNDWTQTARAVKSIRAGRAFALSGTPIENSLDELYSIFEVVLPGLFASKRAFKEMEEKSVARRVRPFVLRRVKEDVLKELPDKLENVQFTELTEDQKAVYLAQLQILRNEVKNVIQDGAFQQNRMKILAGLTRLRQICCHPSLFMDSYEGRSGKLDRLMEYLKEAVPSGKRVVIFSQFTSMLAMIREELERSGWDYYYLDGKTPSSDRVAMAEAYNDGGKPLFLVSLKAGGTGLNLTGGDTVILFDSWWNPAVEEQAADRVHRFGQKNVVQVLKLVTAGTIEEKIHQLQEQKRELMDKVIQTGETSITSLGKDDIQELLQV
ncbi:helicase SNF2 [Alteribacter lacisalsi]|uniref:Helicase SNF2 n=1 Tax=Alteribacter lacisalsi TaxID=2045244 RepID=A0A2W0H4N7_9BACI|nr:SNF2 helicase associated domain-containing protein [Alteribacter lacisalsi]PYZ96794.1 helicase SNF2 [Alteribacter lacisalsi]